MPRISLKSKKEVFYNGKNSTITRHEYSDKSFSWFDKNGILIDKDNNEAKLHEHLYQELINKVQRLSKHTKK